MTTMSFLIRTETLSDGSEVSDLWLFDGLPDSSGIKFTAVTRSDAEALQSGMMDLIRKHTNDEPRDTWV